MLLSLGKLNPVQGLSPQKISTSLYSSSNPLRHIAGRRRLPASSQSAGFHDVNDSIDCPLILPSRFDVDGSRTIVRKVAAPMVAASDYAFRCLCRQHGADLTFTQMLNGKNLVHDKQFWRNHADWWESGQHDRTSLIETTTISQDNLLEGDDPSLRVMPEDWKTYTRGPFVVQLAGHDVDTVVSGAMAVLKDNCRHDENNLVGFDLNLGCPQGIARKGKYGAFLMDSDAKRVGEILRALRLALPSEVTLSAKIRLATTPAATQERVLQLLDTGIDFLTIHGRTRHENKNNVRASHADEIAAAIVAARESIPSFPVIANGGIEYRSDISQLLRETGASAVMSSEALLETPFVFHEDKQAAEMGAKAVLERQFQVARDYLQWCRLYPPLPGVLGQAGGSCNIVRGHLFKILHRYLQYEPDLREMLASHDLQRLNQAEGLVEDLYSRYVHLDEEDPRMVRVMEIASSWYRRHRRVERRMHTRSTVNGTSDEPAQTSLLVEERKRLLKQRIAKLQQDSQKARLPQ